MLKFIKNDRGIVGLTLSQIGLMIATGILLTAVFLLVFQNDWQREAELKNIASSFTISIEEMDSRFFEDKTSFHFPNTRYSYNVSVSTEYITISSKGKLGNKISVKGRFLVRPWLRSKGSIWINGTELHKYLKDNFGNSGNISDPVNDSNGIKNYLNTEWKNATYSFALEPLYFSKNKTVYIEKVCIYYKGGDKRDIILIYQ